MKNKKVQKIFKFICKNHTPEKLQNIIDINLSKKVLHSLFFIKKQVPGR